MNKRQRNNWAAVAVFFSIPLVIYWFGGGDFTRDPYLAMTTGFSFVFGACAWGIWE